MPICYFPRYHSKENQVTSNTMLMLSRLYQHAPDNFFAMLNSLLLEGEENPEITFTLQRVGEDSVPDAVISQQSFKIVVETKLNNQFTEAQLMNHLGEFGGEDRKVLLTLDPCPMAVSLRNSLEEKIAAYNQAHAQRLGAPIFHRNLTFGGLLAAMGDVVSPYDFEMTRVLEDFRAYCFEEGLLTDRQNWMRAIAAGTTMEDNIELNLYYNGANRGFSKHGYIGLYHQKSVRAVGKLVKTVLAVEQDGVLCFRSEGEDAVTEEEKGRIGKAIELSVRHGYDLRSTEHRYFLVDRFYTIDFRKITPYPVLRSKYFNLAELLDCEELPDTESIAEKLNGRTWE